MDAGGKKFSKKKLEEIQNFINKKYIDFKEIIQRTMLAVNDFKSTDIISSSNLSICNDCLELLFNKLKTINLKSINSSNYEKIIDILQTINNDLSTIFKKYGTGNLKDFIDICLDKNYIGMSYLESLGKSCYLQKLILM